MLPDWRIFYADGTTYDSNDGPVTSAPREGFVCAVGYDLSKNRYIMQRWDFYRWDDEHSQFWGMDIWGLLDWLTYSNKMVEVEPGFPTLFRIFDEVYDIIGIVYELKKRGLIFEGRTVAKEEWQSTMIRVADDPEFPVKQRDRELAA